MQTIIYVTVVFLLSCSPSFSWHDVECQKYANNGHAKTELPIVLALEEVNGINSIKNNVISKIALKTKSEESVTIVYSSANNFGEQICKATTESGEISFEKLNNDYMPDGNRFVMVLSNPEGGWSTEIPPILPTTIVGEDSSSKMYRLAVLPPTEGGKLVCEVSCNGKPIVDMHGNESGESNIIEQYTTEVSPYYIYIDKAKITCNKPEVSIYHVTVASENGVVVPTRIVIITDR